MDDTKTVEQTNVELDSTEKQFLKDAARLDTNISFIDSILDADGEVQYELQKVVISFDTEKRQYKLTLKSKGMVFETTASPDKEEFNDWISKFITSVANNLKEERKEVEVRYNQYVENKPTPIL